MFNYRQLIPLLACLSLSGCITYTSDGYYSSPNIQSYDSDDYYENPNDYNGNYGQYEYYGYQPSVVFNINIGYGYGGGYSGYYFPYYGFNTGYYGHQTCNAWSYYCYGYRPSYGWGNWPVYEYRPHHHHHHNPKPPRDNSPGDHDNHVDGEVLIGDDYPKNNGTRPRPRPGALGQSQQQVRTPPIFNGNNGMMNPKPRPVQPAPIQRPIRIDGPNVVDDNDTIRPPKNYPQQPKPVRPYRPIQPIQVDEDDVAIDPDLYNVRTYNAQQPNPGYRAKPVQQDQVQNYRRQANPNRNSYAQPLHADVEPSEPRDSNNAMVVQPQPKQPKQTKQANTQKSEPRQPKHYKEEGDD